jgi:hypothetical protein
MALNKAITYRTVRTDDIAISVTCPKCRSSLRVFRTPRQIDRCGFEIYSCRCELCTSSLSALIDPNDDVLLVSVLEPTIGLGLLPPTN